MNNLDGVVLLLSSVRDTVPQWLDALPERLPGLLERSGFRPEVVAMGPVEKEGPNTWHRRCKARQLYLSGLSERTGQWTHLYGETDSRCVCTSNSESP